MTVAGTTRPTLGTSSGELSAVRVVQTGGTHNGVRNNYFTRCGHSSIGLYATQKADGSMTDSNALSEALCSGRVGPLSDVDPGFEGVVSDSLYALSPVFVVSSEVTTNSAPTFASDHGGLQRGGEHARGGERRHPGDGERHRPRRHPDLRPGGDRRERRSTST